MMFTRASGLRSWTLLAVAFAGACASSTRGGSADDALPDGASDGGTNGFGSVSDAGTRSDRTCSADLRDVLDPAGNVVVTCPPDQGCGGGSCVAACDAAAANRGTLGCDFLVPTPPSAVGGSPCFAVFLANNWEQPVTIKASLAGTSYDVTTFGRIPVAGAPEVTWPVVPSSGLPPGQVAVLFMSSDPQAANGPIPLTCPVATAVNAGTAATATARGQAFHITTSAPVTGYDIMPYGGARSFIPSAELLLPTTAWGTNYLGIVAIPGKSAATQWGQVVAAADDTTVKVLASVNLVGGVGVDAAPKGSIVTYHLKAGEVIQWSNTGEMSGTVLSSDKPIGFIGGNAYGCFGSATSTGGGCDSTHQQVPPVSALGSEYVVAPYTTRRKDLAPESVPYRFVGAVDGTMLTYDPPIAGAPVTLSAGQVVDFETTSAFRVKTQDNDHPLYIGQVMPGCNVTSGSRPGTTAAGSGLGDEEFVNVLPPAQFLKKYVFFTDPTYGTTNLVFVRQKSTTGFDDVTLDCVGTLSGWQPIGTSGELEMTNVDLLRAGVANGTCMNGLHVAKSEGRFGLTVWGLDTAASYAYPAGGNVSTINSVVIPTIVK